MAGQVGEKALYIPELALFREGLPYIVEMSPAGFVILPYISELWVKCWV